MIHLRVQIQKPQFKHFSGNTATSNGGTTKKSLWGQKQDSFNRQNQFYKKDIHSEGGIFSIPVLKVAFSLLKTQHMQVWLWNVPPKLLIPSDFFPGTSFLSQPQVSKLSWWSLWKLPHRKQQETLNYRIPAHYLFFIFRAIGEPLGIYTQLKR